MGIIYTDLQKTREDVARKFQNMVNTYKRIKNRNNARGRNATCWDHFDNFEEIYGTKYPVNPPLPILQSSLKSAFETEI